MEEANYLVGVVGATSSDSVEPVLVRRQGASQEAGFRYDHYYYIFIISITERVTLKRLAFSSYWPSIWTARSGAILSSKFRL